MPDEVGVDALTPAVFLDRDGVINYPVVKDGVPHPPDSIEDFRFVPGAADACRRLREDGFLLIVVTNQPDVARGAQIRERVEALNELVRRELPVQEILTCYHDDQDGCDCRKPRPGLLLRAASRWDIQLARSFMVGDRWSDVEAGRAAGCAAILIERDYSRRERCRPDWVVKEFSEAVQIILNRGETK